MGKKGWPGLGWQLWGGEKWTDSRYILKVVAKVFAGVLDTGSERQRGHTEHQKDLSNQVSSDTIYCNREGSGMSEYFWGRINNLVLGRLSLTSSEN